MSELNWKLLDYDRKVLTTRGEARLKTILLKIGNDPMARSDAKMAYTTSRGTRAVAGLLAGPLSIGVAKLRDNKRLKRDLQLLEIAKSL